MLLHEEDENNPDGVRVTGVHGQDNPNDTSLNTSGIGSGIASDRVSRDGNNCLLSNEETVSFVPGVYSNTKKQTIYLNDTLSLSKALLLIEILMRKSKQRLAKRIRYLVELFYLFHDFIEYVIIHYCLIF